MVSLLTFITITKFAFMAKKKWLKKKSITDPENQQPTSTYQSNESQTSYLQPVDSTKKKTNSSASSNIYEYPSYVVKARDNVFDDDEHDYCVLQTVEEEPSYQALSK